MEKQLEKLQEKYTKYEIARILGARALQLAMDAPVLKKMSKEELENMKYDPLKIAEVELVSDVLPITVKRPLPRKKEEKIKEKKKELEEKKEVLEGETVKKIDDKEIKEKEREEEKEIIEEGDIMALAKPEDEVEEESEVKEELE